MVRASGPRKNTGMRASVPDHDSSVAAVNRNACAARDEEPCRYHADLRARREVDEAAQRLRSFFTREAQARRRRVAARRARGGVPEHRGFAALRPCSSERDGRRRRLSLRSLLRVQAQRWRSARQPRAHRCSIDVGFCTTADHGACLGLSHLCHRIPYHYDLGVFKLHGLLCETPVSIPASSKRAHRNAESGGPPTAAPAGRSSKRPRPTDPPRADEPVEHPRGPRRGARRFGGCHRREAAVPQSSHAPSHDVTGASPSGTAAVAGAVSAKNNSSDRAWTWPPVDAASNAATLRGAASSKRRLAQRFALRSPPQCVAKGRRSGAHNWGGSAPCHLQLKRRRPRRSRRSRSRFRRRCCRPRGRPCGRPRTSNNL